MSSPAGGRNPFALLGLPERFDLDEADLQRAYLRQQQACHPDRFATADAAMRQQALQRSMDMNEAYAILKSPVRRAQALLAMHGLKVGVDATDAVQPTPAVLGEVMEWREALAEAMDAPACAAVITELHNAETETIAALRAQCGQGDWLAAAHATLRLQYLEKTLQDAKARQRQLVQRASL